MKANGSIIINQKEIAKPGLPGSSGYTYRPRGLFSTGEVYTWDDMYRDVVLKKFDATTYTFRIRVKGSTVTVEPSSPGGDARWEGANELKFVATDLVLSRQIISSEIQSGAITADKILAGTITSEKLSSDFIFTKQIKIGPDASHVNFSVDTRGSMYSVSGKIGGFDISSSRIGTVFSSTVEDDGMSLYNFAIKFKDTGKLAVLGTTTYPSSLAKATLLRLELNEYQPSIDNVLSFFDCRGASGNLGSRNIAIKVEAGDVDINGATYLWGNMFLGVQQASSNLAKSCFLFKGSMTITLPTPAYGRNQAVWFSGGSTGGYIRYSRDGETKELHLLADEGAMFVYGDTGWNVYSGKK